LGRIDDAGSLSCNSGMEEVLEVITGTPQAMASSIGIPKLSRREG